jgi:preprotein translocase subunit SecB
MKESVFQLIGKPRLSKFEFRLNKEYKFDGEIKLDLSNDIQISKGVDEHFNQALVVLNLGVFETCSLTESPFQIHVEIEGYFKWEEALEKDQKLLDVMLKQNAPAILYSYVRPIITMMTVEANLPPLVIPLMNFQKE